MPNGPKIVYPDADIGDDASYKLIFDQLKPYCEFEIHTGRPKNEEEYIQRIKHADGVLLGWNMPISVMKAAPKLKIISFTGVGAEKFVDLEEAKARQIYVCNCPGYSDNTVAEHAMALLLALARQIPVLNASTKSGRWIQPFDQAGFQGIELRGKTIGLIGFGGIGMRFAELCQAFDMEVLVWTRNMSNRNTANHQVQFVELDQLYRDSDVISLHLAATPETQNFIDETAFKKMMRSPILINTARGEIIGQEALISSLSSGQIRGAALDVFVDEPLPSSDPLAQLDNVILTPHIGYRTPEATQTLFNIGVNNLIQFLEGNPINIINNPRK
ncbi:MAG: hypothetical protein GKR96_11185 [Gammaproteobacteria bacterium]|nr:hypothetical protein [Gammaproteobacteria bacterium]